MMQSPKPYATAKSKELFERASKYLVEGVSSPSRSTVNYKPYPIFMKRGHGSKIYDVDDNEYIDFMMAYGALSLGHAHPRTVEAVKRIVENEGSHFATASEIEADTAETICKKFPAVEKVRFANTGTEAVMAAVRVARAFTGRKKIVKFEGAYHGWYDDLLVSAHARPPDNLGYYNDPIKNVESSGIPDESLVNTIVVPWNDPDILERKVKERRGDIAAVLIEPIMCNMGVLLPNEGYLQAVREITEKNDVLYIIDEVNTVIKLALAGAHEFYHVDCDLTTYGKALGNGFPVAAIGGRADIMDTMRWGGALHYGAQNASNIGLNVVKVNLEEFQKPGTYERLFATSQKLKDGIKNRLDDSKVPGIVQGEGPIFQVFFTNKENIRNYREFCAFVDTAKYPKFVYKLFERGIYTSPSSSLHWTVSPVHNEAEIELTLEAVSGALDALKKTSAAS